MRTLNWNTPAEVSSTVLARAVKSTTSWYLEEDCYVSLVQSGQFSRSHSLPQFGLYFLSIRDTVAANNMDWNRRSCRNILNFPRWSTSPIPAVLVWTDHATCLSGNLLPKQAYFGLPTRRYEMRKDLAYWGFQPLLSSLFTRRVVNNTVDISQHTEILILNSL